MLSIGILVAPTKPKRFSLKGGVMNPTSAILSSMTSNYRGSKSRVRIVGKIIGTVRTIIAIMSNNMPRIK